MEHTYTFRAMDTDIDVLAWAPYPLDDAFQAVERLFSAQEDAFSRFRDGSLVSRLNRGESVNDARLLDVWRYCVEAYDATAGLFNPMVLPALAAAGYDRTFDQVRGGAVAPMSVSEPRSAGRITAAGLRLVAGAADFSGIVKGWTVDLAVELLARFTASALVNAGGDMRVFGDEPGREGWDIAIAAPSGDRTVWRGPLTEAVATSSTRRRRWLTEDGAEAHHLIDPRSGLPCAGDLVQVSVFAPTAREAETWSKAILIGGGDVGAKAPFPSIAVAGDGRLRRWLPQD